MDDDQTFELVLLHIFGLVTMLGTHELLEWHTLGFINLLDLQQDVQGDEDGDEHGHVAHHFIL